MNHEFDFIILGGGAVAFAAATKAFELGAKTLMINDGLPIGGTCVNVGCVPSKHLLEVGKEVFYPHRPRFDAVAAVDGRFDFARAIREKNQLVETLRQANYLDVLEHQKQHVTFLKGRAEFVSEKEVAVKGSYVKVDKYFRTSIENIFAAGDVIGPPFLETIAAKEGNFAAQNALNKAKKAINFDQVPHAVFTSPEVASVGLTEAKYMRRYKYCYCRTIDFTRVPKALAVKFGLTIDDIIDTVHVFPTFSEAIKLVAQSFVTDIGKMSCCVV
jgi:pyruvate/2-oxoglutarate dehydrogenase complex dihydrolipoamide dehydrogenase (E3) component